MYLGGNRRRKPPLRFMSALSLQRRFPVKPHSRFSSLGQFNLSPRLCDPKSESDQNPD